MVASGPPRLPMGVPPSVVQAMLSDMLAGRQGPGPMVAPGELPAVVPPGTMPGGPQGPMPPQQPPMGTPSQQGGGKQGEGVPPQIQELLEGLAKDPKARRDIEKILKKVNGDQRASSPLRIEPTTRLQLAQGWNARVDSMGRELANQRGIAPGASKTGDEALLRIYYTTPMDPHSPDPNNPQPMPLEDIDEYADAVRLHLVTVEGMTDPEKIEDQVMRYCFPLRESLIRSGRRRHRERVEFVAEMQKLTERWLAKYGRLPDPDPKVLKATERGKGNPESQARDEDSEDLPPR